MKPRSSTERPSFQVGRDGKHAKDAARHSSPVLGSLQIRNRDRTRGKTEDNGDPESAKLNMFNRISNSSDISVPGSNLHTDSGISSFDSLAGGDKRCASPGEQDFVSELLKLADTKFADLNARESWVDEDTVAHDMKRVPAQQTNAVLPVLGNTTAEMARSTTSIFMTAMDVEVTTPYYHDNTSYEERLSLPLPKNCHGHQQKNDKLACTSCGDIYATPRLLPCLHTFCTNCLQSRVHHKEEVTTVKPNFSHSTHDENVFSCETLECPTCSTTVELSLEGVYGLPINHSVQRLLLLHNLKSGKTGHLSCDLCPDSSKMEARCVQCNVNMCQFCFQAHKRQSLTAAHYVISCSELNEDGPKLDFSATVKKSIPIMCQRHTSEELKLYCIDCSQLVCRDCCLGSKHRDHKCEYMTHVIDRKTSEISTELASCKSKRQDLEKAAVLLEQSAKKVQETAEEVAGKVERHFASYINTLQRHKASLLAAVENKAKSRNTTIQMQKNEIKKLLNDISDSCEFTSDLMQDGSSHEILSMKPYVLKRLRNLSKKPFLEPAGSSENFVEFVVNKKVKAWIDGDMDCASGKSKRSSRLLRPGLEVDICGDVVCHAVEAGQCTAHGEGIQFSRLRLPAEFMVVAKNFEGQKLGIGGHDVTASITMEGVDPNLYKKPKVQITDRQDGTYRVLYIVYATGSYSLDVRIFGRPVQDSPFSISAMDSKNNVHSGIFHCCAYCSGGGDRNTACACGTVTPGSFKGCRHGHTGHPGGPHWSCCGKTTETSSCDQNMCQAPDRILMPNHNHVSYPYSPSHHSNTLPVRRNQAREWTGPLSGNTVYSRTQRGFNGPDQYARNPIPISPLTKQVKTITL